jgi:hypothetical protein
MHTDYMLTYCKVQKNEFLSVLLVVFSNKLILFFFTMLNRDISPK